MPADPKGRCNYCNVYVGRDKVKTCGRCRLVRYCSKECQVAAWKTHKQRCAGSAFREGLARNPAAHALHTALSRWINIWRTDLHDWACVAMDLANNPEDRLATHSMVIELARRLDPPSPSFYFKMVGGDIMTRENLVALICETNEPSDEFLATMNQQRSSDTAQIIIICEDLMRVLWFSLRDGGAALRQVDSTLSRSLSEKWQQHLIDIIDTGEPSPSQE